MMYILGDSCGVCSLSALHFLNQFHCRSFCLALKASQFGVQHAATGIEDRLFDFSKVEKTCKCWMDFEMPTATHLVPVILATTLHRLPALNEAGTGSMSKKILVHKERTERERFVKASGTATHPPKLPYFCYTVDDNGDYPDGL